MSVNFIIQRATGGTINLQNKNLASLSTVTKGTQKIARLGEDIVNISVESAVKVAFHIGDKIIVFGRDYRLNRLPIIKKEGKRLFSYDLEFEGVQYDLMRATYDLTIDTTNNELQDVQADTLTGNLERFATVLIANANRVFPDKWVLGGFPADTENKTLTFAENDNCLSVAQRICSEYNIEFDIEQDEGVNTLHFRKSGQIFSYTFEYGKGKGLYSLERQNVSSANIVTRLKVFGSTRNITARYRAQRLCLPGKTKGQSYMEKPDAIVKYGMWEATKYFEDIYPRRTGKITGLVSGSVLKFVDNTINFDLNEKEADGVTTKYLLNGVAAKIHFNSGNLSGYEFELQSYDHATKTFTLKPFKDERDDTFPSEKSEAFQFGINDEYKILDIALPQAYIDTAEAELETKGNEYYDQNSQPKVQYALEVAEEFLKSLSGSGSTVNIFSVGDYIPVKDDDIDVDKSVRVQSFTRDLLNEYAYQLTISDTVATNITNRVISELIDIDKIVKINNLKDPARAKRDWRSAQELLDVIFDVEGDYYSEKIKPGSIETQMLSVGAKSTQFGLVGTVIQANYNGNKNSVSVKGGVLTHYTIEEDGRIWNLADNTTTLTGDSTPYYIYAKCQRVGTAGSVIFSTEQIKVEQDPDFYHFFVGVVNSVDTGLNVRSVALTYGFTTINGRYVRTGRIQSNDGTTYFDLDLGEIGGKIKFGSGGSQTDLSDWADDITGDIQDTQQAALDADHKAQQALDDAVNIIMDFNNEIAGLQQQIDGEVSNWFYPYSPTLSNYPASDWTTNTEKDRHIGDTFTNTQAAPAADAGKSWRFVKNGTVYSWTQISDSDAVKALQQAAQAQATADGKSTTFLVQPSNYHLGDTWVLNADRTIHGTAYKQGEILTATQDSTTFVEAHWIKRVRYTDDTSVDNLQIGDVNLARYSGTGYYLSSAGTLLGIYSDDRSKSSVVTESGISAVRVQGGSILRINQITGLTNGKTYTWRIMIKGSSNVSGNWYNWVTSAYNSTALSITTEWVVYTKTFVCQGTSEVLHMNFAGTFFIADWMLVEGNKVTEGWSTNILDVEGKLDANSKGYVNAVRIGGRNYLLNSASFNNISANDFPVWPIVKGIENGINWVYGQNNNTGRYFVSTYAPLFSSSYFSQNITGQTITVSVEVMSTVSMDIGLSSLAYATLTPNTWARINLTIANGQRMPGLYTRESANIPLGTKLYYRNWKVEIGNKPTDWSRAPEDDKADIDAAKLEAERAQLAADGYIRARYIRDWSQGNSTNTWNQWYEIEVINKAGINIALGKIPASNGTFAAAQPASYATDGNRGTYAGINNTPVQLNYARIDLGQIYYDIDYIAIKRPYVDGRRYYNTKTEISEDGVNWTSIFDSALSGTYSETEQGKVHTLRPASVLAKLNTSAAITDKFGTTVDGGLITTVMMILRELSSSQVTAGISGIQGENKDNPAFWAGGTYAKAFALIQFLSKMSAGTTPSSDEYDNLAKITMLHDGAAKVGDFIIEKSGRIVMVDPATGKTRLQFGVQNIPLITTLMGENNPSGGPITIGAGATSTSQVLTGSIDVTYTGATATFGGTTMNISGTGQKPPNAPYSTVDAMLWLRKNGARLQILAVAGLAFTEEENLFKSRQVVVPPSTIPLSTPGAYTFELVIVKSGLVGGEYATTTASTFSWIFTVANVRRQEYGLDGMMFFYSNHHFHFTETGGLDGRAAANKWNTPGVLLSATVNSAGGWERVWGAKRSTTSPAKNSAGRYTVYHTIGHMNYQVTATALSANRSCYIVSKNASSFIIEWRTIGSSPGLIDTNFDVVVTGNNYNT